MVFLGERPLKWLSPERKPATPPRLPQLQFFPNDLEKDPEAWFQMASKLSDNSTSSKNVAKSPSSKDNSQEEENVCERDPCSPSFSTAVDYDALEFADRLEMGLSREIVSNYMTPVRSSLKLERYNVLTENGTEFRLLSDDFAFLLYARLYAQERRVDIFQYDPKDEAHYDVNKPAFRLNFNSARTEWSLVQERCQCCLYSPVSCGGKGKQQLACVRHFQKKLGDGVSNCMEVKIPGVGMNGSPVVWCSRGKSGTPTSSPCRSPTRQKIVDFSDYGDASPVVSPERASPVGFSLSTGRESETLTTKMPTWNEEFECLVLDFEGRSVTSSAHNFQLAHSEDPAQLLCQYGKIGPTTFSLDFKKPLSVVQAFGVSLSTMFLA